MIQYAKWLPLVGRFGSLYLKKIALMMTQVDHCYFDLFEDDGYYHLVDPSIFLMNLTRLFT